MPTRLQPASESPCTNTTIAAIETMKAGETETPLGKKTRRCVLNTTTTENEMIAAVGGSPSRTANSAIDAMAATKTRPVYQASRLGKG